MNISLDYILTFEICSFKNVCLYYAVTVSNSKLTITSHLSAQILSTDSYVIFRYCSRLVTLIVHQSITLTTVSQIFPTLHCLFPSGLRSRTRIRTGSSGLIVLFIKFSSISLLFQLLFHAAAGYITQRFSARNHLVSSQISLS